MARKVIGVDKLPNKDYIFVSDSQDTKEIKSCIGRKTYGFDSFFVLVRDGDYLEVWGMKGIIPYLYKELTKII
jgi:hypothetical protein